MLFDLLHVLRQVAIGLLLQVAPGASPAGGQMPLRAAEGRQANFQPYIFWAYGLVCILLLGFTLWTYAEARSLGARVDYLKDRFRKAHPGALGDEP